MTKEERLEWLKCIEKDIYVSSLESTFADDSKSCAIHSIIEELEQEPILEKAGTLIVTTEHCENVGRVLVQYGTNGTLFYQDQEPRKGHWVTKPHVFGVAYCSECDFELRIDNTNFCPNCGADMREGEE